MATRLTKPVTRLVAVGGELWNVTITINGIVFRPYKRRIAYLLPHAAAIQRAAWLYVEEKRAAKGKKKKRRVTRGRL